MRFRDLKTNIINYHQMDKLSIFNNTYNDFINNLKKCYPEIDAEEIEDIETNTIPLQRFLRYIADKETQIISKNNSIFNVPFMFDKIDISSIWIRSSVENRDVIWKFIQTLALIAKTIRSKSKDIEDFCNKFSSEENGMMQMFQNLMNNINIEDNDGDKEKGEDLENLENIFEGTKIGALAKDIASSLDMSDLNLDLGGDNMKEPDISEIMSKIKDGGIQNIVKNVSNTLNEKMNDGTVNRDELTDEVKSLMEKMKMNPKMMKMMNSKNMQNMMKNMMQGDSDDDFGNLEEMFKNKNPQAIAADIRGGARRAAARKRLRKKIESKRDAQFFANENC